MSARPDLPPVRQPVTQELIDRYAELSGDHNPLHVDPDYAAGTPFGSTIAHGPIALQTFFVAATRASGAETLPPGSKVSVTYRSPVRPGDEITCVAVDAGEEASGDEVRAECRTGDGTVVVSIAARIPGSPSQRSKR
ncbi:MAG: MaoC family dehydratase [Microbispora sp.]|nr:MaoC family dehydratase [Microbispora sp.]